jgi:tripartite motif-containing protein 2/3/tripartite motif-containing protein 71
MSMVRSRVVGIASVAMTAGSVSLLAIGAGYTMGLGDPGGDPPVVFESEVVQSIGRFMSPTRIALFGDTLYVSDTERGHVAIFDATGVRTGTITGVRAPLGLGVQVNRDRVRLLVGDQASGSVRIFEDGVQVGYLGSGDGEFLMPNAIAVDGKRIFVVDSKAHVVRFFNRKGQLRGQFGSQGSGPQQFDFPSDIVVDSATGEVFVSDWGNRRISVWDGHGNWLRNIAAPPNDHGEAMYLRPAGLGIDDSGDLYVVDNALSCVVVMDQAGLLLDVFGYQSSQYHTGELLIPVDAASDGNIVYVTSGGDGRVHVFERTP